MQIMRVDMTMKGGHVKLEGTHLKIEADLRVFGFSKIEGISVREDPEAQFEDPEYGPELRLNIDIDGTRARQTNTMKNRAAVETNVRSV